jgi:hypothetical protein
MLRYVLLRMVLDVDDLMRHTNRSNHSQTHAHRQYGSNAVLMQHLRAGGFDAAEEEAGLFVLVWVFGHLADAVGRVIRNHYHLSLLANSNKYLPIQKQSLPPSISTPFLIPPLSLLIIICR